MTLRFEGTYTALVTPFKDDQSIDWDAFDKLVDAQIQGGVAGIVPCGTTGESPALDHEEQLELIRRAVKLAQSSGSRRVTVLAGTGTNATRSTIAASQAAAKAGADAVMVVVPYYNKPTQDGLVHHFTSVAASVDVPVVAYNVPSRSITDLAHDTLARICEKAPNVVAVKEATGNVLRAQENIRKLGSRITVLCGDDALTLPMIAVGARGVISVTSNVLPAEVSKATRLALDGRFEEARREHLALLAIHEAMFIEANPACPKAALAHMGKMKDVVRGPLVKCSADAKAKVVAALDAYHARAKGG